MRSKLIPAVLALALTVMPLISSCSGKQDRSAMPDDSASESSTSATSVVTAALTDPEPEPNDSEKYRMDDKFTYLSCIEEEYMVPELASIGDGKLLVTEWQYQEEITAIRTVDILEDKIIGEYYVNGYATFKSLASGGFILENIDNNEFCFFDNDLHLLKTYRPESMYGRFSPDGNKYYQIICGKLYCEDVGSGALTHIQTNSDLEYSDTVGSISPDGGYIALTYDQYSDGFYDNTAAVRIDLRSNTVDMLTFDISYHVYSDSYMYAQIYDEADYTEGLYRISLDSGECTVFPAWQYYTDVIAGSDYLMCEEISETSISKRYLAFIDESGKCSMSLLNGEDPEEYFNSFTYMPQEELIACCADKNGRVRICLIEPSLLDHSAEIECEKVSAPILYDETIYEDYLISSYIPDCPARLEELRKRADDIEERYGIKLYISSECQNMVMQIGYDCTDEFFDSGYEYTAIDNALNEIETALEKYPDGFLRQFRCSTGDGGIRICLTSYIHDDFSAAYSIQTRDWYNIVLDIRYNCEMNLAHEIWHSTESYINNKNYQLLSSEVWERFNPDGFEYSDDFKEDSGGVSEYCYGYDHDWYFYDNYSKVNSLEDKARIMEIVMDPNMFASEDFVSSEHIKEKLECMSEAIRQTFDTASWGDDVVWERFAT